MRFPRLVRHADGGVRVTLPTAERALLEDMVRTIREVIAGVDADTPHDEVVGRLFPRAYEDPLEQMEYADTAIDLLAEAKRTMLDTFEESLRAGAVRRDIWRIDLTEEQTAAWLAVLQDGRLVLAQIVGIRTEEDWERLIEADDEAALILAYLGELLGMLVLLLDGALPDEE